MYHRVADLDIDPWDLAVSPLHFSAQLDWLAAYRKPFRLQEFVRRLVVGDLPVDAIALTFDDGYVDNLHNALPALACRGMPATLFLTTGQHAEPAPFWWDELARLILQSKGRIDARLSIASNEYALQWPAAPSDMPLVWSGAAPSDDPRSVAYFTLWSALQRLPQGVRDQAMQMLREMLGPVDCSGDLPMNSAQLSAIVDSGWFDIAAHSISHPTLTALSPVECREEIVGSRRQCEAIAGTVVQGFAYPYGDMDDAVRTEVAAAGFDWACSTRHDVIRGPSEDRFSLPRIAVGDWNAEALRIALSPSPAAIEP